MQTAEHPAHPDALSQKIALFASAYRLSKRRTEVLSLLIETGASSKDLATRLGIADSTLHNHYKAIFELTDVTSKTALLALFIRSTVF